MMPINHRMTCRSGVPSDAGPAGQAVPEPARRRTCRVPLVFDSDTGQWLHLASYSPCHHYADVQEGGR
jgi:hypothetical protein